MKQVQGIHSAPRGHWVGDGFPVRSLFWYGEGGEALSPFLMLDYGGPHHFEPTTQRRGVGEHPHRGFETVTIVYSGEVEHRDSTGAGGVIGPGDVQWMTAAGGIMHEEFHSEAYARAGGPFQMVQLWVNLPAKDKMGQPGYQTLLARDIPNLALPEGAGTLRVIAGEFGGDRGPAITHTPMNVWDLRLKADASATLDLPEGHTSLVVGLGGTVLVNGSEVLREAQWAQLSRSGSRVTLQANGDAMLLVLTGQPLNEPIAGHGPFVMNTHEEIVQAFDDLRRGRFARVARTLA